MTHYDSHEQTKEMIGSCIFWHAAQPHKTVGPILEYCNEEHDFSKNLWNTSVVYVK